MPELLEQVYDSALQLTEADRSKLATRLLQSLPPDDEVRRLWHDELNRRADELRTGKVIGRPVASFLQKLQERYP